MTWENLRTNAWKESIDKQIEATVVEEGPAQFKSVSSSFSVPSNDPWLVSVIRTLETSVMESVSLLGSKVTGLLMEQFDQQVTVSSSCSQASNNDGQAGIGGGDLRVSGEDPD